ncbi:MAG: hypothetical protein Q8P02_03705, partial [Candidatus Micrarchaeota archaeon]|nr:hypothetical protein [Candidatus Micrarchaeota archaeon]
MRTLWLTALLLALAAGAIPAALSSLPQFASDGPADLAHVDSLVLSALSANGSADVIVVLRPAFAASGARSLQAASARSFQSESLVVRDRLDALGMVSGRVTSEGLSELSSNPAVSAVYWD